MEIIDHIYRPIRDKAVMAFNLTGAIALGAASVFVFTVSIVSVIDWMRLYFN